MTRDGTALVLMRGRPSTGCHGCGVCRPGRNGAPVLEASNPEGAAVGQKVTVEIRDGEGLVLAGILYGIPLAGFLLGVVLSSRFPVPAGVLVFAAVFGASWFLGLRLGEARARSSPPTIVSAQAEDTDRETNGRV